MRNSVTLIDDSYRKEHRKEDAQHLICWVDDPYMLSMPLLGGSKRDRVKNIKNLPLAIEIERGARSTKSPLLRCAERNLKERGTLFYPISRVRGDYLVTQQQDEGKYRERPRVASA